MSSTELRWRARIVKQAVLNDDSSIQSEVVKPTKNRQIQSLTLRLFVATSLVLSLASLTTTHYWWATLTVTLLTGINLLLLYQDHCLKAWGSLRKNHQALKDQIQQLSIRNEKLQKSLYNMQASVNRVQEITSRLKEYNIQNIDTISDVVQEHRHIAQQLQHATMAKGQLLLTQAFLQADSNRNFTLEPTEMERLIIQLHNIPGMTLDEVKLRQKLHETEHLLDILTDASIFARKQQLTGILLD